MNISRLQKYTIELYRQSAVEGDQEVGLHLTGGVTLAATAERWEFLRTEHSRHKFMGIESELITAREAGELCPLLDTTDVVGALFMKDEGHLNPYGCTQAYVRAAKKLGAQVHQFTKVEALVQPTHVDAMAVAQAL